MHTKYTNREIWKVAYPILISLLMEQLIGMTDTAFMGRVGEVELGASAIAGVYYLAIFMLGFGFSIGSQILIARRNGEGNFRKIGSIFYQGIYFLLAMYNPQIQISAESGTKRSNFRQKDKTKRSKKGCTQHL